MYYVYFSLDPNNLGRYGRDGRDGLV
jgi:hypothetical protein